MLSIIRYVAIIHHIVLVPVNVLVAKTAGIVHLSHRDGIIESGFLVPSILPHAFITDTIRNIRIDTLCFCETDGIFHSSLHRTACSSGRRMRTSATLSLRVTSSVCHVEEVGNMAAHREVYLLHTSIN